MATVRLVMNPRGVEQMLQDVDLTEYGERVEAAAVASAPVLSGAYQASIRTEDAPDGKGVIVIADVPYAIYVEANTGNLSRALDSA